MTTDYITDFGIDVDRTNLYSMNKETKKSIRKKITSKKQQGTQIISPKTIDLTVHDKFPLLWLTLESAFREWQVNSKQNNYLIVTNLNSGSSEVIYALPTKNKRLPRFFGRSSIGLPPDETAHQHYQSAVKLLDIREQSSLTWKNGVYGLTVLSYDRRSNTEIVELTTAKNDNSISVFQGTPENHYTLDLNKGQFGQILSHDIIDSKINTSTLVLPPKINRQKEKLNVTISIPLNSDSLYNTTEDENTEQHYLANTLILTQLDSYQPYTFNIQIPIDNKTSTKDKTMKITLELDMAAFFSDMPDVKVQTSQIYLVVGSKLIGPQALIIE